MRGARRWRLPGLAVALMSRHGRMGMLKGLICAAAATLALLCAIAIAGAADYPERPVTIVVGFPPGGASDILARIMADKLGSVLGKPFVGDNRPGAGGRGRPTATRCSWATTRSSPPMRASTARSASIR